MGDLARSSNPLYFSVPKNNYRKYQKQVKIATRAVPASKMKSSIRIWMLCLFFIMSFSSVKYVPGMLIVQDVFTGCVLLFLVIVYPFLILTKKHKVSRLELYGLLIIAIEPVVSAYASHTEFDQPYIYGLLAQREIILVGCSIIFLYLYRRRGAILLDAERALIWLAWFSLVVSTMANLFVDSSQLSEQAGFSTGGTDQEGGRILLETAFIIFGFFYYAFLGLGNKKAKSNKVHLSLFFLSYLVFFQGGRTTLLAVIISYLYIFLGSKSLTYRVTYLSKLVALAFVISVLLYVVPLESVTRLLVKFQDAITVVVTGQESNDYSANARIFELKKAYPYIEKNLLFGSGFISQQWNGGFKSVFDYFHPSDIGLVGVVFEFGLLGLILFSGQIYFIRKYWGQLPLNMDNHSKISNALKGFLLYFLLNSVTSGRYVFLVEQSFLCIALLYCISSERKQSQILKQGRLMVPSSCHP